jgi:transcriptional regulator with XRE-family HTH domain
MYEIRANQVKAARALLGLSQEELAVLTGLSIPTIRKIESGAISPRSRTMNAIRHAIEDAGWEFIYPEGIRRRQTEIDLCEGTEGADFFFNDIMNTVRERGGEIYGSIFSLEMFVNAIGANEKSNGDRLKQLCDLAPVKCLLAEPDMGPNLPASCHFRMILKCYMGNVPYFVYGDRFVLVLPDRMDGFKYTLHRGGNMARSFREGFLDLWDMANPLMTQATTGKHQTA